MFTNAAVFNKYSFLTFFHTKDVLEKFNKNIVYKEDKKQLILDVGCGSGNVTTDVLLPAIPVRNFKIVGIDISESMIDFSNAHKSDWRLSFRILDISEKNEDKLKSVFTEEELTSGFDVVYSFATLHWPTDYKQAFKNIYDLLRPGGQILVWFFGFCNFTDNWEAVKRKEKWRPYIGMQPPLTFRFHDSEDVVGDVSKLIKSIGFHDVTVECQRLNYILEDKSHDYRGTLEFLAPWQEMIPKELRTEYLDDTYSAFKELTKNPDDFKFDRIVVVASKPCQA
uniref:Methyltransferase type 12 domain-containing protein n=1 Tax=Clastoptera arizonana TaxID=38151 RepID=A0A1B6BZQ1_9HEMI